MENVWVLRATASGELEIILEAEQEVPWRQ